MAGAYLWYYPEAGKTLEEIAVSSSSVWGDIQELPEVSRAEAQSVAGSQAVSVYAHPMRVRLLYRFSTHVASYDGAGLVRKLATLQNHLDRGGLVWATNDRAKAWAGYTSTAFSRGDTSLRHGGLAWGFYSGATFASGDEVVVQSFAPTCKREYTTATAVGTRTLTLGSGLVYDYAENAFVRHRDFYCCLRFPTGQRQNILTHDRRNTYTLDLTLEEDLPSIEAGRVLTTASLATVATSSGKVVVSTPAAWGTSPTGSTSTKPTFGVRGGGRGKG